LPQSAFAINRNRIGNDNRLLKRKAARMVCGPQANDGIACFSV
jgi:hypothetical protein